LEAARDGVIPPLSGNYDEILASKDPSHIQFCADINQGNRCVLGFLDPRMDIYAPEN
jgi:hypothetical protein